MMEIYCGECHAEINDEDWIIMDVMNGLTHSCCLPIECQHTIKDIDHYKNLKEKYWFLRDEELLH